MNDTSTMHVCHITTVHPRYDIRIFVKEASSLAKEVKKVTLIVADNLINEVKNGVNIVSIGKPKGRMNRVSSFGIKALKEALKQDATVYHIHDPEIYWLALPLRMYRKKVILDMHEDLPVQMLSKHYLNIVFRKMGFLCASIYEAVTLSVANYVVTATPFIRDKNKKYNKNTFCISNFPIQNEFKIDRTIKAPSSERAVCYTGGLTSIRGVSYLIDSVLQSNGEWVLHLAGSITDNTIKTKLDQALMKTNRIKYWGNVDRDTVKHIFSISSAGFVTFLPVPNHINAIPNKLFEYMSAGLPVICSNFKYWEEIVKGNETGIMIDPTNISEIINSVEYIIGNQNIASNWGENGIKAIGNIYNWESEVINLINIYKKI